ncbi:DNA mismatch repair endonuclease MutL [Aliidiomarina iranensis]|nr:DNA mismatch repair endonuclease MutL [Aliidiomarina iranensis]
MAIRLLPPQLANQIAAGEVVERPASVVKELVENCIDAGATELHIDIEKGGARRIRIRDNGSGIPKDELELALSRHATSKIASLDDLEAIHSLGFRGEALASISSVSRLCLSSKPAQQAQAWQAWCEGRDMQVTLEPTSHPDGTTVDVQDLFFNTPARRKFLRTEKTEFGHIDEVVRRIALACPAVEIKLSHNQQLLRHYPKAIAESQILSRLQQIAGKRFADEAIFLELAADAESGQTLGIRGWIAPPDACRHQTDVQYMYVNGRMMKDKLLNHAVRQAYGDSLASDRQATYILYITLPANDVDVNVHPAKHEVRFQQARQVHDFVLLQLREALGAHVHAQQEQGYTHHYEYSQLQAKPESSAAFGSEFSGAGVSGAGVSTTGAPTPGAATPGAATAGASKMHQNGPTPGGENSEAASGTGRSILPGAFVVGQGRGTASKPSANQIREQEAYQSLFQTPLPASETATANANFNTQDAPSFEHSNAAEAGEKGSESYKYLSLLEDRWLLLQTDSKLALLDIQQAQFRVQTQRIRQQLAIGLSGQPLLMPVQLKIEHSKALEFPMLLNRCGVMLVEKRLRGGQYQLTIQQVPEPLRKGDLGKSIPKLLAILDEIIAATNPPEGNFEEAQVSTYLQNSTLAEWLAEQGLKEAYSVVESKQWLAFLQQTSGWQRCLQPLNWRGALRHDEN